MFSIASASVRRFLKIIPSKVSSGLSTSSCSVLHLISINSWFGQVIHVKSNRMPSVWYLVPFKKVIPKAQISENIVNHFCLH